MTRKEKYTQVIRFFSEHLPDAQTELHYKNPYELLIAVVLSAQCTDKRVNLVTPALFEKFPNAESLAKATVDEVFFYIKSISYPNNKAKHLVGLAQELVHKYNGKIMNDLPTLMCLPGVGRKTANVITSVLFSEPNMAVDTHVFRVSQRIGLVKKTKNFLEVEKELTKNFPKDLIHKAHHWLILHGRYTCLARNPICPQCGLSHLCNYYKKTYAD